MSRPVEAETFIEGENVMKKKTAAAVMAHMQDNPAASVVFAAARQEIFDRFRDTDLGLWRGQFSATNPDIQLQHRDNGLLTSLFPSSQRRLYGPQWTMIVFDSSVGPELTDQHVKEFRAQLLRGLHGASIVVESCEGEYESDDVPESRSHDQPARAGHSSETR